MGWSSLEYLLEVCHGVSTPCSNVSTTLQVSIDTKKIDVDKSSQINGGFYFKDGKYFKLRTIRRLRTSRRTSADGGVRSIDQSLCFRWNVYSVVCTRGSDIHGNGVDWVVIGRDLHRVVLKFEVCHVVR